MSDLSQCPSSNELEISIFGPGFGESIVIHLGNNFWIIVDSCIDPFDKKILPLAYLQNLKLDLSKSIKKVIVTHWHDDHIRGISDIFECCINADFICSTSLRNKEFLTILAAYSNTDNSGLNELYKIINILRKRNKGPIFAIENRTLYENVGDQLKILSLSPSDHAITQSILQWGKMIPKVNSRKLKVKTLQPNETSVGLLINSSSDQLLLGADIENLQNDNDGWSAVIRLLTSINFKSSFYKVSHHGAKSGDQHEIWDNFLIKDPFSGLTSFKLGSQSLPTPSDKERLLNYTKNCYMTKISRINSPQYRSRIVKKTISETVKSIEPYPISRGHIRFRKQHSEKKWNVELFGDAEKLE